jgi:thiopeptide-type bacteriocin biosynthesis protein
VYQYLDAAVVRAAVLPVETAHGTWPDLTGETADSASWRPWLRRTWEIPGFADAVEQASPSLARRVREICGGRQVPDGDARRAVLAVMRYLLRASGRATPFGLFAGVAPARIGDRVSIRVGSMHRSTDRVDAGRLAAAVAMLEAEPTLRLRLKVLANNLVSERDGYMVLEHRAADVPGGPPVHVRVRATRPVRMAMSMAAAPIRLGDLTAKLAVEFAAVASTRIDQMLGGLVSKQLLVTNLHPAMTTADPVTYLGRELHAVTSGSPAGAARASAALAELTTGARRHVDLRVDWDLVVPREVAAEAARAADVLVGLAPRPFLSPGWAAWHGRFLDRYGPRAVIPVLDAVDAGAGLGYPAGFLGGPPVPGGALTDRDVRLLALAQHAALRRQQEVPLDEAIIASLATVSPRARSQPTAEVTVRVHADSPESVCAGRFILAIVGVSRAAGTTIGRFLDMLDPDRTAMSASYAGLPTATANATIAQISAPTLYASADNVARAPQVMRHVIALGEYRDDGGEPRIALDDIAVTADADRLYLLSRSLQRVIEPIALNAIERVNHTHPLARFLAEATNAMRVPCTSFDWGAAAGLPFLPALRYGRILLAGARWLITPADLPGPATRWREWDNAFAARRDAVALPQLVYLGDGDQRIGLDLAEPAHRALVRAEVDRSGTAVLRDAPEANATGWSGGYVHEITIPLAAARTPAEAPWWLDGGEVTGRAHGHHPGSGGRFSLKLYAGRDRQTVVLTRHLPRLLDGLGTQAQCWFLRYGDRDQHLRVRLTVPDSHFAPTAATIGAWTEHLQEAGLITAVQWDAYFPETARFGGPAAMAGAESFFAADSAAALAQLALCTGKGGPAVRAMIAASMLDIAIGLLGDADAAAAWLIARSRTTAPGPSRALYNEALALAGPEVPRALTARPGGERILACWARRRTALTAYRNALLEIGSVRVTALLPELLHLHHARMAGAGLDDERLCVHLARAAALSWTARARKP